MCFGQPLLEGRSLLSMMQRSGAIKLWARYYSKSEGKTRQVAALAWAKAWRQETGQAESQVASRQIWLSWEVLLT